jgi:hypothetical protein
MAQPVLFDDGGSTRIKQIKATGGGPPDGHLDSLIEVAPAPPAPAHSNVTAPGAFTQIQMTCLDDTGAASFPFGGAIAMAAGHTFKIHSGKHRVEGKITGAGDCEITVSGVDGTEPIVEARHSNGQRRYIISNAPSIQRVDVNAAGPAKTFNVPQPGTIYTVVILS